MGKLELLHDIVARFNQDIESTEASDRVRVSLSDKPPFYVSVVSDTENLVTVWLDDEQVDANQLLGLIGTAQDAVVEELHLGWPECPEHGDWLQIDLDSANDFVWRCEHDSSADYRFGALGRSG